MNEELMGLILILYMRTHRSYSVQMVPGQDQ